MTKLKTKTLPYDTAEHLDTPEEIAAYLEEALETGDAAFVAEALGIVARARGMTQIARDADLSRESLYKSLRTNGNPELATVLRVLQALQLKVSISPATARTKKRKVAV
jgi:probable addiction module antidote protein